jgi:hypothetical protein
MKSNEQKQKIKDIDSKNGTNLFFRAYFADG